MTGFGPSFAIPDTISALDYDLDDAYARNSRIVRSRVWNRSAVPQTSGSVWHVLCSYEKFKDFAHIVHSAGLHERLDGDQKHILFVPEHVDKEYFASDYLLVGAHILSLDASLDYLRKNVDFEYPTLYAPWHKIAFRVRETDGTLVANGAYDILQHIPASNGSILIIGRPIVPEVIL
jgi:hypothetical protein